MAGRYEAFTSPVGTAVWPWISQADTRYDPDGIYKTELSVPFEEAQDFIAKLEKALSDHMATLDPAKRAQYNPVPVYVEEYTRPEFPQDASDMEKDAIRKAHVAEPTGNVLFKFKLNKKVTPRDPDKEAFTQEPIVVSADTGEKVEDPLYMGSIIRIKGQIAPYVAAASRTVGVTLRMRAVQVIELKTGGGNNSSGFWTDFNDD